MSDRTLRSKMIRLASTMPAGSPDRKALLNVLASSNGNVKTFLGVLTSKLTQYDKKISKKNPNTHRLGLLLEAAQKTEKRVSKSLKQDSEKALKALKAALLSEFTHSGGKPDLPPVRNVFKQIDAFLASGKIPSITAR